MSLRDAYKLDESLAFDKGFRVEFNNELGDSIGWVDVRYAGPSNKKFTAFRQSFMKPYERKIASGNMSEAESDRLTQEVFIKGGIVSAWSEDCELNVENFKDVMNASAEMWRDIYTTAYNAKFFTPVNLESETKN